MAELADAHGLEPCGKTRGGSSPLPGTQVKNMSTQKDTVAFILSKLGEPNVFTAKAMFGEYALYAHKKVVGLICDNQLYVKDTPDSASLKKYCEKDSPYPNAKQHWLIEESLLSSPIEIDLPNILKQIALARHASGK